MHPTFGGPRKREIAMMSWRRRRRLTAAAVSLLLSCVALAPLVGCDDDDDTASATPSPSGATMTSPDASSGGVPASIVDASVPALRGALRSAYLQGQRGGRFEAERSVIIALRKSFASDPSMLNGASRAVLLWACPFEMAGHRSTPTRQYVIVYFWAEGEQMIAAGTVAPGFSGDLMRLSRSSPDEPWHVDGHWTP
jgi:hypothetical protein